MIKWLEVTVTPSSKYPKLAFGFLFSCNMAEKMPVTNCGNATSTVRKL